MKLYYVLSLSALLLVNCADNNQKKQEKIIQKEINISDENKQEVSFVVEGMTCQAGCANNIKKHLENEKNRSIRSFEHAFICMFKE